MANDRPGLHQILMLAHFIPETHGPRRWTSRMDAGEKLEARGLGRPASHSSA